MTIPNLDLNRQGFSRVAFDPVPVGLGQEPQSPADTVTRVTPVTGADLIVQIVGDTHLRDRAYVRNLQQHSVLAPIAKRHPGKQRQVGRAVWWWLWLAVCMTLIIVALLYHNPQSRSLLAQDHRLWTGVGLGWLVVSVVAYVGWIEGRGVCTQATFVLVAVLVQGVVLALLTSLFFHRSGMFGVVFFMYLLTAQALASLCPYSGHVPLAGTIVYLVLAVVLIIGLIMPLHSASEGWVAYPYGSHVKWLEPPVPVWQAYVGALLGTLQMLVVSVVYVQLTRVHDESQTLFIVGRLYLVVVYGWKILWYTLATRGCRISPCGDSPRR
jgi:hypothetical protein